MIIINIKECITTITWRPIFKAITNVADYNDTGGTLYNYWINTTSSSFVNMEAELDWIDNDFNGGTKDNFTFKSSIINDWNSYNISEVRLSVYKNGSEVQYLIFNNSNASSSTSWMSINNVLFSTWSDITESQTFMFFSLGGDTSLNRNFDIFHQYGGCEVDSGWLVATQFAFCSEYYVPEGEYYPNILYSPGSTLSQFAVNVSVADTLVFWINDNNITFLPTHSPINPISIPTLNPVIIPTSHYPTQNPNLLPVNNPSQVPSNVPTNLPSKNPTFRPTIFPTKKPTNIPTTNPTSKPTIPTRLPTSPPSAKPSKSPTIKPTRLPTSPPSPKPSKSPTNKPTKKPV